MVAVFWFLFVEIVLSREEIVNGSQTESGINDPRDEILEAIERLEPIEKASNTEVDVED